MTTRQDCLALDARRPARRRCASSSRCPPGVIYLDGNSLGALPRPPPRACAQVVARSGADGLIRSWNSAGWIDLPQRIGDKIARLVGADAGELVGGRLDLDQPVQGAAAPR